MYRSKLSLVMLLILFITSICPVFAQIPTGGMRGTVKDPKEAVISDAKITVTSKTTGATRTVKSNSDGEYQVGNLAPGEYEVKVTMQGFKTGVSDVHIQVGENATIEFVLEVGQANETITVVSETPTINVTDHKIDGVVGRKQIESLPLNGRNFLQLALLEPGVGVEAVDNPGT